MLRCLGHDGDTCTASGACLVTLFVVILHRHVTSRPSSLDVSPQMQGVGLPTSDSMPYLQSCDLDSITEILATVVSAIVSNVVGMIGSEAGLRKMQI